MYYDEPVLKNQEFWTEFLERKREILERKRNILERKRIILERKLNILERKLKKLERKYFFKCKKKHFRSSFINLKCWLFISN